MQESMLTIFDNVNLRVVDDLRAKLNTHSKVSIAAASFSIYAFEALKDELENVDELRFIFTSPTFIKEKQKKEKREFYIPKLNRERNLYGSEFEIKLRNQLSQKAIAKECADWIRRKVRFKSNSSDESMPGMLIITLYHIFNEFLEDISEDVLPNENVGFKKSVIWLKLFNFQRDAALACINKLEKYHGCILADSVGLGKTFTALAVIKYYELRNKSVLVLCPKKLNDNWITYKANYTNNPIAADRLNYDVFFHSDLTRDKGETNGMDLELVNWSNYDLLVIDESHNFRNGGNIDEDGFDGEEYEGEYRLLLNYKEAADAEGSTFRINRSFVTEWISCKNSGGLDALHLTIEGSDMDAVYEHFAGAISGFGTHSHAHTQRIIELEAIITKKARQAESLQKKIRAEKQFNRQMELNGEARRIKREIAELRKEMEKLKGEG